MKNIKILIDARRKINSGVGRVSQWITENIPNLSESIDCYYLVGDKSSQNDYNIDEKKSYFTDIKPFTSREFDELPAFVESTGCDLYINAQTTWSPLHTVPTITMIHDLWAINNAEWLPTTDDLKSRFDLDNLEYFEKLDNWFSREKQLKILTGIGMEQYCLAASSSNIIWKGAWAQYAAMIELSSRVITVSPFIQKEVNKLFLNTDNVTSISNIPSDFSLSENIERKHLLTLSKLERRKNLDYLIDAYVIYVNKQIKFDALPLIIAGDPGYKGVANDLKKKVRYLNAKGYDIRLLPSVTDKKLKKLFAQAACLIFPSHYEGFGLPSLEGMLSMIPVIATSTGIMTTDLGKFSVKIDGHDPIDLASKMQSIIQNPPTKERLMNAKSSVLNYIKCTDAKSNWKSVINDAVHCSLINNRR